MSAHILPFHTTRVALPARKKWRVVEYYGRLLDLYIPLLHRSNLTPNAVTVGRSLLIIPCLWCIAHGSFGWATIWFLVSSYGDHVDGVLARYQDALLKRKHGQRWWWAYGTSESGKLLDPTCDKIVNQLALFTLIPHFSSFGVGIYWIIFVGECALCILAVLKYLNSKGIWRPLVHMETGSNIFGKSKTAAHIMIISLLLISVPYEYSVFALVCELLLLCTIPLSLGSIGGHLRQIIRAMPRTH